MGHSNNDINRFLNAEHLFGDVFSQPISNFGTLYGFQPIEEEGPVFHKNISRLINGSKTYRVVQL